MDKVALGRALGFGARQAARTLMKAADAVGTPDPRTHRDAPAQAAAAARSAETFPPGVTRTPRRAAKRAPGLGRAVLAPVARYTGVLWLEVTGAFFAVFAVMLGTAAWRQWPSVHAVAIAAGPRRFYVYVAFCAVFAYFAISSFVRARRRERR